MEIAPGLFYDTIGDECFVFLKYDEAGWTVLVTSCEGKLRVVTLSTLGYAALSDKPHLMKLKP